MKVVILAGGFGTRLSEETTSTPKPMVEIGGRPLLWHIMKHYDRYGFREFVIALGYRGDVIKRYFLDYRRLSADLAIDLRNGDVSVQSATIENWHVRLVDTGETTLTGGRIKRLEFILSGEAFMLTYGDGVSDVPLDAVLAHHRAHKRIGTVTAVRPPSRFGGIAFGGDEISEFKEKPAGAEGWINGGFMVFEPDALSHLRGDEDVLETDLLERLAQRNELAAYRHHGFWQCCDTVRDRQTLARLWAEGKASWKTW